MALYSRDGLGRVRFWQVRRWGGGKGMGHPYATRKSDCVSKETGEYLPWLHSGQICDKNKIRAFTIGDWEQFLTSAKMYYPFSPSAQQFFFPRLGYNNIGIPASWDVCTPHSRGSALMRGACEMQDSEHAQTWCPTIPNIGIGGVPRACLLRISKDFGMKKGRDTKWPKWPGWSCSLIKLCNHQSKIIG